MKNKLGLKIKKACEDASRAFYAFAMAVLKYGIKFKEKE